MSVYGNLLGLSAYLKVLRFQEEEGYALYMKARQKGMTALRPTIGYAVMLVNRGQFERARELLEPLLRRRFKDEKKQKKNFRYEKYRTLIRINLALALWKLGDYEFAMQLLRRLERGYGGVTVYCAIGSVLLDQRQLAESLEYTQKRLAEYDFEEPALLDNLGQAYMRLGRYDEARESFEKALEQNPRQRDSHFFYALLLEKSGRTDAALEHALKARECNYTALCASAPSLVDALIDRLRQEDGLPPA